MAEPSFTLELSPRSKERVKKSLHNTLFSPRGEEAPRGVPVYESTLPGDMPLARASGAPSERTPPPPEGSTRTAPPNLDIHPVPSQPEISSEMTPTSNPSIVGDPAVNQDTSGHVPRQPASLTKGLAATREAQSHKQAAQEGKGASWHPPTGTAGGDKDLHPDGRPPAKASPGSPSEGPSEARLDSVTASVRFVASPDEAALEALAVAIGHPGEEGHATDGSLQPPSSAATTDIQASIGPITDLKSQAADGFRLTCHYPDATVKGDLNSLVKLEPGARPYTDIYGEPTASVITRAPPDMDNVFFMPVELGASICSARWNLYNGVLGSDLFARMYVLMPSSMKSPGWLRERFNVVSARCVEVDWGHPTGWKPLTLRLAGKREDYSHQVLTIWYSKTIMRPGDKIRMMGPDGSREVLDQPYVLGFKFARSADALRIARTKARGLNSTTRSVATSYEVLPNRMCVEQALLNHKNMSEWVTQQGGWVLLSDEGKPLSIPSNIIRTAIWRQPTTELIKDLLWGIRKDVFVKHVQKNKDDFNLIVKMAWDHNDPDLLIGLLELTDGYLQMRALRFLIHSWAHERLNKLGRSNADSHAKAIEGFLIRHVTRKPNPLSITAAILSTIEEEIYKFEETDGVLKKLRDRFRSLHIAMLTQLGIRINNPQQRKATLHRMVKVLIPEVTHSDETQANDISPLTVALQQKDQEFVCHPALIAFFSTRWKGWEFAESSVDNTDSLSIMSSQMGYRVMKNLGLAGSPADFLISLSMRTLHAYAVNSLAFFNSPRGRWAMHAMCELIFLIFFQILATFPSFTKRYIFSNIFLIFILGNLLDLLQFVAYQYGSIFAFGMVLKDPWDALNVITNVALLGIVIPIAIRDFEAPALVTDIYVPGDPLHMAYCAMGVLVWIRILSLVVPVFPDLGPLLNTVWNMTAEIVAFLFPFFLVLAGFATVFTGVYSEVNDNYQNFIVSLVSLYSATLGNFDFAEFEEDSDGNKFSLSMVIYGSIFMSVYLLLSSIMLLNLLIAIITRRYDPDSSAIETQYKNAQIVTYYSIQVEHNLVCSPLNMTQLLLFWIPGYDRDKVQASRMGRAAWFLLFLSPDGPDMPDDSGQGHQPRTGKEEYPNLCFLLTLYPMMAITSMLAYCLYTPFAVFKFAVDGGMNNMLRRFFKPPKVKADAPAKADSQDAASRVMQKQLEKVTDSNQQLKKEAHVFLHFAWQIITGVFTGALGLILYLSVGLCFLLIMTLWWWLAKVVFSLWNILVQPWIQVYRIWKNKRNTKLLRKENRKPGTGESRWSGLRPSKPGSSDARTSDTGAGDFSVCTDTAEETLSQARKISMWLLSDAPIPSKKAASGYMSPLQRLQDAVQRVIKAQKEPYISAREMGKALQASKFEPFLEEFGVGKTADLEKTAQQASAPLGLDSDEELGDFEEEESTDDEDKLDPITRMARDMKEMMEMQKELHNDVSELKAKLAHTQNPSSDATLN